MTEKQEGAKKKKKAEENCLGASHIASITRGL